MLVIENVGKGSSPHTRGAPSSRNLRKCRLPDHPRIRGEHENTMYCSPRDSGSSPHTRGAPPRWRPRHTQSRIIPAYAGSTSGVKSSSSLSSDHPRIRGEHPFMVALLGIAWGSSPHTRGARGPDHDRDWSMGIIPAYAGSTRIRPSRARKISDHPRIRGEHGSTPSTPEESMRIIPAYAGSTKISTRRP